MYFQESVSEIFQLQLEFLEVFIHQQVSFLNFQLRKAVDKNIYRRTPLNAFRPSHLLDETLVKMGISWLIKI